MRREGGDGEKYERCRKEKRKWRDVKGKQEDTPGNDADNTTRSKT